MWWFTIFRRFALLFSSLSLLRPEKNAWIFFSLKMYRNSIVTSSCSPFWTIFECPHGRHFFILCFMNYLLLFKWCDSESCVLLFVCGWLLPSIYVSYSCNHVVWERVGGWCGGVCLNCVSIAIYGRVDRLVVVNCPNAVTPIRRAAGNDRTVCEDVDNRPLCYRATIHWTMDRANPKAPYNFSCRKCNRWCLWNRTYNLCTAWYLHCMPMPIWSYVWTHLALRCRAIVANTLCSPILWNLCDPSTHDRHSNTRRHRNRAVNWNHRRVIVVCCWDRICDLAAGCDSNRQVSSSVRCSASSSGSILRRRTPDPNGCGPYIRESVGQAMLGRRSDLPRPILWFSTEPPSRYCPLASPGSTCCQILRHLP